MLALPLPLLLACALISDAELAARLDLDADGVPRPSDCDDDDPAVGLAGDLYADADADGFGAGEPTQSCDPIPGFVSNRDDCDDLDPAVAAVVWYLDGDDDGYGQAATSQGTCEQPEGYSATSTDCDDGDSAISPASAEVLNDGVDQNCDGRDAIGHITAFGHEMVALEAGSFRMGTDPGDPDDLAADHDVSLTHPFWIGRSEVTQDQWAAWSQASSPTPAFHSGCGTCPVEEVSWQDSALYANALSDAEGLARCYTDDGSDLAAGYAGDPYACEGYRLPTEAEWEYAARAGDDTAWAGSDVAAEVAWTMEIAEGSTHPVCTLRQNAWDLCDLSGNVAEWGNDWYGVSDSRREAVDPSGPAFGSTRMIRDGNWGFSADTARLSLRYDGLPDTRNAYVGLRLARVAP